MGLAPTKRRAVVRTHKRKSDPNGTGTIDEFNGKFHYTRFPRSTLRSTLPRIGASRRIVARSLDRRPQADTGHRRRRHESKIGIVGRQSSRIFSFPLSQCRVCPHFPDISILTPAPPRNRGQEDKKTRRLRREADAGKPKDERPPGRSCEKKDRILLSMQGLDPRSLPSYVDKFIATGEFTTYRQRSPLHSAGPTHSPSGDYRKRLCREAHRCQTRWADDRRPHGRLVADYRR